MDELRKGIEALPAEAYKTLSYYGVVEDREYFGSIRMQASMQRVEHAALVHDFAGWKHCSSSPTPTDQECPCLHAEKWSRSAASALMERGILTLAEIEAALGHEEEAEPPVK